MSFDYPLGATIYDLAPISFGAKLVSGYAFKGADFGVEGHPVVKIKNIQDKRVTLNDSQFISKALIGKSLDRYRLANGDILIAMTGQGSVGRVGKLIFWGNETPYLNQRVGKFEVSESILNLDFLYYVLSTKEYEKYLFSTGSGSGQPNLSPSQILSVEIPYPSLDIQESIAKILCDLDDKIELNRQTNQTLEQIAQALFKNWFVDFEPTRAKMAAKEAGASPEEIERAAMCAISGKTPDQLSQLPPEAQQNLKTTAALFPDALMDSELGEIPVGWEVKQLSEVGNIVCGKTPPKDNPEYYDGEFPFIKIPDMHGKVYATKTSDTLTHLGANTQIKKLLPKDSVCVSCIATVGLVSLTCADSFTNQQINTIVPNDKNYSQYLYFAMLGLNDHLHDLASGGSATLNLNTGYFSKIKIVFPDEGSLENFSNQVMPIFDLILKQSLEIDSLERIRDSLLPKLLSGEIET